MIYYCIYQMNNLLTIRSSYCAAAYYRLLHPTIASYSLERNISLRRFHQRYSANTYDMSDITGCEKTLLRLGPISGVDDTVNDMVFCGDNSATPVHVGNVVFFGGDVQDYTELMEVHRDNRRYVEWNVEKTASLLRDHFSHHRIYLVKPNRMTFKTFSVYSSFVDSDDIGCPNHSSGQKSWNQLVALLSNAGECRLKMLQKSERGADSGAAVLDKSERGVDSGAVVLDKSERGADSGTVVLDKSKSGVDVGAAILDKSERGVDSGAVILDKSERGVDVGAAILDKSKSGVDVGEAILDKSERGADRGAVILVGFSKGCVVLNQLLYDLAAAKVDGELSIFVNRVRAMYWLDGGHNGGSNTWITSDEILHGLVGLDMEIFSHVTPYQIKDPMRKWIGKEQKKFVKKLQNLKIITTNTVHFADEERSIENHFGVLRVFITSH